MQPPNERPADGPASEAGSSPPKEEAGTPDGGIPAPGSTDPWPWIFGLLLFAAAFVAYLPAMNGGFVWDDDTWTTGLYQLFQNTTGLEWIWFKPTALTQYYPLTATSFWLDYQFWKFWTLPYHIENVVLHAVGALLFWRVLVRLKVPGAWLAAGLFALHPVMVESAAWIAERKNVLSLPFFLAALLAYLRYEQGVAGVAGASGTRDGWRQSLDTRTLDTRHFSIGSLFFLFLCALLAKTTAFAFPAVILLIGWWKRGSIRWRADVLPMLPFFALSIGLSAITAWQEKTHVGAQGEDFGLSIIQRFLVAGRIFWFYPVKFFWPTQLSFVYPRWEPDPAVWWQWLFPLAAIGILLALWLARGRIGRGPATAMFYYIGTLFPVLGFINVYFMRYSFVSDHWVYLSSLGVLALVAALAVQAAERLGRPGLACGFAVVVLPVLGVLTWRQAGSYKDMQTLWFTTLERNPDCWMAQNNLGAWYFSQHMPIEAEALYRDALQINPGYAEAWDNLGTALAAQGRLADAITNFEQALSIKPDYAQGHYNLGLALAGQRKWAEAIEQYKRAIELKPDYLDAINNLGTALAVQGKKDEAIEQLNKVLQLRPNYAAAYFNLGLILASEGKLQDAIVHYQQALTLATAQGDTRLAACHSRPAGNVSARPGPAAGALGWGPQSSAGRWWEVGFRPAHTE